MFISDTERGVVTHVTCGQTWRVKDDADREQSIRDHRGLCCGSERRARVARNAGFTESGIAQLEAWRDDLIADGQLERSV